MATDFNTSTVMAKAHQRHAIAVAAWRDMYSNVSATYVKSLARSMGVSSDIFASIEDEPMAGKTLRGIYTGNHPLMNGKTALLRNAEDDDYYEAQFDAMEHGLGHGWHKLLKSTFALIPELDEDTVTSETKSAVIEKFMVQPGERMTTQAGEYTNMLDCVVKVSVERVPGPSDFGQSRVVGGFTTGSGSTITPEQMQAKAARARVAMQGNLTQNMYAPKPGEIIGVAGDTVLAKMFWEEGPPKTKGLIGKLFSDLRKIAGK